MEDGQVILYGPNGEPLFKFRAFRPYQRSGAMGFLPPSESRSSYDYLRSVQDGEGPSGISESDESDEAEELPVQEEESTEDGACFRPT